jgi:oligopeptidase B
VDLVHGETRVDDYFWLRDRANPEVAAYLEAENAYADEVMARTAALQESLYAEMLGRIQQTDTSAPYPEGGHLYYSRTEEGKQYPIYCRRAGPAAEEETLVDLNALAAGRPFMALGAFAVSDDGSLLAYSTDPTGFREYTLHVKDLRTGGLLPDVKERVVSAAWAADGRTLFYTVEDAAKRSYRLFRHALGEREDELVYEEQDERFSVHVGRTRSRELLLLVSSSHTASETRFLSADRPSDPWRLVQAREAEHEYEVDHRDGSFLIRTNDRGRNFRLVRAPVERPGKERWAELVPHRPDVMLEAVDAFARHAVLLEREAGLPHVRAMDLVEGGSHRVSFPEPVYSVSLGPNREWDTARLRIVYESLVTPQSAYDYDMRTRARTLVKTMPVLGGFDASRYASERIEATASDGMRIPISLVVRKGVARDGSAPLHLHGYGSYGFPMPIAFSSHRLSLLDRGIVCAIAHVRGGGDLGKPWHDQGRMMSKPNTFTDFIAVAEHLVREGYTSPDRLAIEGASAGGLLMGAVANMRPELFGAVVSKVPFVDVVNSMLDETLPLTVGEFEEWGNPKKRAEYDVMRGYCPYSNLAAKAYPAMLVRTAFHDSQVMFWEPAKYVAKLRTLKTDDRVLLLKTNMAAGHGGASGRYDHLREIAFDYAFLLAQLGLAP